ncbi:MAG: 50S ribosomal protein L4 [Kofleriaceae bacterium]|jgi:large subunit ribosomal protein L4|nr:50S ribosomal protein L4 [Kofleriaceae bacterium]MBP9171490.1 50S ribosomal protein L4 [Kofleriaceae bacterium]MBP9858801.1 50S ribosomal protein L4 [Kofleriaceae bacterium]
MKLDVKNTTGKSVGQIDLADDVFATEVHEHLLWEVVKWQLARRRAGNASTKRMSEVTGSSKKVWKQKGTGQARQGSKKGPHWVGGGSVFGPKPRSYDYALPKKVKKAALRSALSLRAGEQKLIVVDQFPVGAKQLTKTVATALKSLGLAQPTSKVLIVDGKDNAGLVRGAKNLASSQWLAPEGLNVYDILRHETVVISQGAVKQIEAALTGAE